MRQAREGNHIRLDVTGGSWGLRIYLGSMQSSGTSEVVDLAEVYMRQDE